MKRCVNRESVGVGGVVFSVVIYIKKAQCGAYPQSAFLFHSLFIGFLILILKPF